ncbi:hypothetical protein [Bacillus suaedaesalsae]|uniref:Uncharacterized protein n=1 Tax=Bacillus suaedaesalsae TaxID=2810349 RepID=A0ABS2DL05_9BACI|nr:hypothetical protein [Bacillus suaedaesalsae]MBM6619174.1 hypothetical protein [Bacillus suaedaesalsae]
MSGLSNVRGERLSPVQLVFSGGDPDVGLVGRFSDAVFQSARILENQVKEQRDGYHPEPPPSIELLYASKDGTDGVSVTILFHQTGPSVIFYSKKSPTKDPGTFNQLTIPKVLEKLCIGYENRYSYFTIPNVEKNCQI